MQIIPAIDLKDNKCVRLSKGKDETSIVYNQDPEKQAIYFQNIGCKKLHLIDLDAAFGRPNVNFETIKKIRKSITIPIQLGGGVRNLNLAKKYFDAGINNLIIGSMSVEKPNEVIILSNQYADKVYVSLDILEDNIMIKGWDKNSGKKIQDILDIYTNSKIKGYVITDIQNDGMLKGLNLDFVNNFIEDKEVYHIISYGADEEWSDFAIDIRNFWGVSSCYDDVTLIDDGIISTSQFFFQATMMCNKLNIKSQTEEQREAFQEILSMLFTSEETSEDVGNVIRKQIVKNHTCFNRASQLASILGLEEESKKLLEIVE